MKKILKEKLKNKFILILLIIIISILWFQWYKHYKLANIDRNTYVVLVKWETKINNYLLKKDERKKLKVKDKVITWKNSACVIEWWDWSLTRLWENSKIEIQELNVKKDLSKINLQFKLINWKTWSNVISFLWEDSYFKQNFKDKNDKDIEAAVRWTIFDVNLKKDYMYVTNHEVLVEKWKNKKILKQNQALSISSFSLIDIKKFVNEIQDKAWEQINSKLDKKFLDNLSKKISKEFNWKNINNILSKNKSYNELLIQYQKLNFVPASESKLFAIKNKIKEKLISKASDKNKQNLVKYSVFDLKDAINNNNINLNSIKDLEKIVWNNTKDLKNILWEKYNKFQNIISSVDYNKIQEKADKVRDNGIKIIWSIVEFIKNILK